MKNSNPCADGSPRLLAIIMVVLVLSAVTAACAADEDASDGETRLQIVTSISILADLTEQIVGERGKVDFIVPIGEEPEEYEPVPSDFRAVSDADVFFVNGYGVETWLERMIENVSDALVVATAEGGPTIPLAGTDKPDPHLWLNPEHVRDYYIEEITATLIELDPQGKEYYRQRSDQYAEELTKLHHHIKEETGRIPAEHRVIITSENCFKYYAEAYDFDCMGIWEINAPEEGTPQQIARIIEVIRERDVPAVFRESTIDPRYMESISGETGVPIGGIIYSDDLGEEGSAADSYIEMMRHNTDVFVQSLID